MTTKSDGVVAAETRPTVEPAKTEFPKAGVKFWYVVGEFLDAVAGGRERLKGWTTARFFQEIIIPSTLDSKCSYCDMLKQQGHPAYGAQAQVFVSHAHSFGILDFLSALEWQLRDDPDIVVWIDLFSINQHMPMDWSFDWLSTTFKSAVDSMGRTIMVMSPWDNPVPFQRSWCVFEAYCTAVTNSRFDIAMTKSDERAFMDEVKRDPESRIDKMSKTIRAEKSQCSVPSDRDAIFAVIRSEVGFSNLDSMVFERYREWVIQASLEALESCSDTHEISELLYSIGALYASQGNYAGAERCFKECLTISKSATGENDPEVVRLTSLLGRILMEQGKFDETQVLFEKTLDRTKDLFGDDHPDTLRAMSDLATVHSNQGDHDRAQELYKQCLEQQTRVLGVDEPDTLRSMNSLATVLFNQGQYSQAEPYYNECFERRKAILGPDDPDTLSSMNDLATLLGSQGRFEDAEAMFQTCLKRRKAVLGEHHANTLMTMNGLASIFFNQGKHGAAEVLYRWCYEGRRLTLGEDHIDTKHAKDDLQSIIEEAQEAERQGPFVRLFWGMFGPRSY